MMHNLIANSRLLIRNSPIDGNATQRQITLMTAAERVAVQLPRAHRKICQNANDLAREAVGWNGGLGGYAGLLAWPYGLEQQPGIVFNSFALL
jgi:hypothetical protein